MCYIGIYVANKMKFQTETTINIKSKQKKLNFEKFWKFENG